MAISCVESDSVHVTLKEDYKNGTGVAATETLKVCHYCVMTNKISDTIIIMHILYY